MILTDEYRKKIELLSGEAGKKWLKNLPEQINYYEKKWNIKTSTSFSLSYNYVCSAITVDNKKVVLKISFPNNTEFISEIEALKRFSEQVSIKIENEDLENNVVLLEQAVPGIPVSKITNDEEQVYITSQVIKKLHVQMTENDTKVFSSINDWAKIFDMYKEKTQNNGPIPKELVNLGHGIFTDLLQENRKQYLLHGDLHNDNILSSSRGWLVIDPKGIIGEQEFELGAFLRNPFYDLPKNSNHKETETRRIIQFADELCFDPERIRLWALASSIISMVWFWEDEGKVSDIYLRNAELIRSIKL